MIAIQNLKKFAPPPACAMLLSIPLLILTACGGGEGGSNRNFSSNQTAVEPPAEDGTLRLTTMEGVTVVGKFTKASHFAGGVVLLLHQKAGNMHEYDTVIPKISEAGFDVLAIDLRGGGSKWGFDNETVKLSGELDASKTSSVSYDIQAASSWLATAQYSKIIVTGSSYSAALALLMIGKNKSVAGIACFSPGEYVPSQKVSTAAGLIKIPFFMTQGPKDKGLEEIFKEIPSGANIVRYFPKFGTHGAASMRKDENPNGYEDLMAEYIKFLVNVTAGAINPVK